MNNWVSINLKDICKDISYGYTTSSTSINTGINFLRITDIAATSIDWDRVPFCNITDNEYKKYEIKNGDIVIARTGATVGYAKQISQLKKKVVFASYLIRIKIIDTVDSIFIGKLIESSIYKNYVANIAGGSAQPNANAQDLVSFTFRLPPLEIQRKIAAMLAAYDELIEVNRQRISLLEQAAEELYREWFVRMRFPGYEHTPIEHGIPHGWEVVKVEQAFDYTAGGTPSKNIERFWKNGTINWYTPSDITASQGIFLFESNDKCTEEGLDSSSSKIFPAYSIMMTSRATIGAIGINTTEACTNQGFITCIPNKTYPLSFLYHWLKTNKTYFESLCGGATFLELTKGVFKNINILTPPIEIMEIFERKTRPLIDSIENYQKQNQKLQTARAQLLPKLMAGTLDLSDLDIHYPPSMS